MHLAILITNTDDSAFARARPDDGEKFATLIQEVRPDWRCTPFWVCRGAFPKDIAGFDGVIVTGSPASVHEEAGWITQLEAVIKQMIASGQPLFGACFGHQLIAKSLGAPIVRNPQGWGHGRLSLRRVAPTGWAGPKEQLSLYGSHIEQVGRLPAGARTVFEGEGCAVAGFALGETVFTVQHHPEMSHAFISDLVDHYAEYVGDAVTAEAQASLGQQADRMEFADEIARFFEHAVAHRGKAG